MKRTVAIEINGLKYPLRQTLNVTEWMTGKYGSLTNMITALGSEGSSVSALLDVMAELMKQGAAYEDRFGDSENWTLDDNGHVAYLTREDLGLFCDDDDIVEFTKKILEAYNLATAEEISAVETSEAKRAKKKDSKKAIHEATK